MEQIQVGFVMKEKKCFFIYNEMSTFVYKDLEILDKYFDVKTLKYNGKRDIPKLLFGVFTTDFNFSWFALGYATIAVFFSKIFKKKSFVVAGGWDVVDMPEIDYGAMRSQKRVLMTKFTLKYADCVLTVSNSTENIVLHWWNKSNVETVYHGFDDTKYSQLKKKDLAITVGTSSWHTLNVKGIKNFIKSAAFLPDVTFMLVGPQVDDSIDYLKSIAASNVIFRGYTSPDELSALYGCAKVYVQISAQESFGCALAEAMLCECVPVVTNRGALPEVVGDVGFYVDYDNPEQTAQKIKEAMESNKGSFARERIKTLYPIEKREKKILEIIDSTCLK